MLAADRAAAPVEMVPHLADVEPIDPLSGVPGSAVTAVGEVLLTLEAVTPQLYAKNDNARRDADRRREEAAREADRARKREEERRRIEREHEASERFKQENPGRSGI